jgi:transcriptional regulator with XRE-family HTH domain
MENLRYDRKMTQDAYLEDVISQRQYYRYRSGESEVPFDCIIKFANKLQIPLLKLISSYQSNSEKEKELVKEFLNLVISKKLDEATIFKHKLKNLMLLDEETQLFFSLSKILYDFFMQKINNVEMIEKLKDNIDFGKIMKKEILHDSEIYILGVIMEYSHKDRLSIYKKINKLLKNDKLLLGSNSSLYLQVFFWIVKNLGKLGRYNEAIEMARIAIEYAKSKHLYYAVEYFHYYLAYSFYMLKDTENFEMELSNTIKILLYLDEHKRKHFFDMIKKDTNIDSKSFILERLNKELT